MVTQSTHASYNRLDPAPLPEDLQSPLYRNLKPHSSSKANIQLATLIVAVLVHEEVICYDPLDNMHDGTFDVAVRLVGSLLTQMEQRDDRRQNLDALPLPFDW